MSRLRLKTEKILEWWDEDSSRMGNLIEKGRFVLVTVRPYSSNISSVTDLILTNFKISSLGPSFTDVDRLSDICQVNIWPGITCSYQQYLRFHCTNFDQPLSCYWPNCDQTLNPIFGSELNIVCYSLHTQVMDPVSGWCQIRPYSSDTWKFLQAAFKSAFFLLSATVEEESLQRILGIKYYVTLGK